ncbi:MAG: potassium-transporting ATPase subunit KdpC [Tepidisphaeraceae bacterium]
MTVIRPAVVIFLMLTLITGIVYPAVVTAVAQFAFPRQANGSIITRDGRPIGSSLVGQNFADARYFWPRPSYAGSTGYDATSGSGSNLAPSNPALADAVRQRVATLRSADPGNDQPVPVELVTASASGLDPHLSPAAVEHQLSRVARVRGLSEAQVRTLVQNHTTRRTLGLLGEPVVNVVELNLALDEASRH